MFGKFEPCAFEKWARFDSWPVQQAAFILMGLEPPSLVDLYAPSDSYFDENREEPWYQVLQPSRDRSIKRIFTQFQPWEKVPGLCDMARALDLAVMNQTLPSRSFVEHSLSVTHVTPTDLIRWAHERNYPVPPELDALFPAIPSIEPTPADNAQFKESDLLVTIYRLLLLLRDKDGELESAAMYSRRKYARGSGLSKNAIWEDIEALLKQLGIPTTGLGGTKTRKIFTAACALGAQAQEEQSQYSQ